MPSPQRIQKKKIPWSSLAILIVTYATFGWTVAASQPSLFAWPLAVAGIFLLASVLTAPLTNSKKLIQQWFKSDVGAFMSIVLAALLAVVVVTWLHLFATGLVLFSAGALTRLDIQTSGFKKTQAFWILAVVSLIGLGIGATLNFLLFNKI